MNRESLLEIFSGLFGGAVPSDILQTPNVYWPLPFETFNGTSQEDWLCMPVEFGMEMTTLSMSAAQFSAPNGKKIYEATMKALQAHNYQGRRAIDMAHLALGISNICPEAHIVLALNASSFEEALHHFQQACDQGPRVVSESSFKKCESGGDMFGCVPLRAYVRGLFGAGNTLRKLKKYKEALPYYETLSKLIRSGGSSGGTFLNFNCHVPEVAIGALGFKEALKYLKKYPNRDCIEFGSCQVDWYGNMTLACFATGLCIDYKDIQRIPDADNGVEFADQALSGFAFVYFVRNHPLAVDLLLGIKEMPSGKIPGTHGGGESLAAAACYVHSCGELWSNTPGALEYLRKVYNTEKLGDMLEKSGVVADANSKPQDPLDVQAALELLNDGVFPNTVYGRTRYPKPLLTHAIYVGEAAPVVVEKLLSVGAEARRAIDSNDLNPLHQACYYGCGRRVVRLLADAGLDLLAGPPDRLDQTPLIMAASQGQYQELEEGLMFFKERISPWANFGSHLTSTLFESVLNCTCLHCGERDFKCCRCKAPGSKGRELGHGPGTSYTKVIDLLFDYGLEMEPEDMENLYIMADNLAADMGFRSQALKTLIKQVEERSRGASQSKGKSAERCGNPGCTGGGGSLKKCSRCRVVKYCSAQCQKAHWSVHKKVCKAPEA